MPTIDSTYAGLLNTSATYTAPNTLSYDPGAYKLYTGAWPDNSLSARFKSLLPSGNEYICIPSNMSVGGNGQVSSLLDALKSSAKVRYLHCDTEVVMLKSVWDLILLYINGDGYGDLTLSEFLDKSIAYESANNKQTP